MTIAVFAIVLSIGGGWFFWRALTSTFKGCSEPAKDVEVRKRQHTSTVLRHLEEQRILRDHYIPLIYIKVARHGESIKAGIYEFSKSLSAAEVVDKLIRGDV